MSYFNHFKNAGGNCPTYFKNQKRIDCYYKCDMPNAEIQLYGLHDLLLNFLSISRLLSHFGQSKLPEPPAPQVLHLQSRGTCTSAIRGGCGN